MEVRCHYDSSLVSCATVTMNTPRDPDCQPRHGPDLSVFSSMLGNSSACFAEVIPVSAGKLLGIKFEECKPGYRLHFSSLFRSCELLLLKIQKIYKPATPFKIIVQVARLPILVLYQLYSASFRNGVISKKSHSGYCCRAPNWHCNRRPLRLERLYPRCITVPQRRETHRNRELHRTICQRERQSGRYIEDLRRRCLEH
jgi:hypothetical protein